MKHSFNNVLLSTHSRPVPDLGAGGLVGKNTDKNPYPQRPYVLVQERDNAQDS